MTEEDMKIAQQEDLDDVLKELQWAADRAGVTITASDLGEFVAVAREKKLRGRKLEREARKFCSHRVGRDEEMTSGLTRVPKEGHVMDMPTSRHTITGASSPVSDMNTANEIGRFHGIQNPNSIWDPHALDKKASEKQGDELIRESIEAKRQRMEQERQRMWQEIHAKLTENGPALSKGIQPTSDGGPKEHAAHNPPMRTSDLSMFSGDRDFGGLPARTDGEKLADQKELREREVEDHRADWDRLKGPMKAASMSGPNSIFGTPPPPQNTQTSQQRSALDKLFEGFTS
jgi:hypothetical protein